MVTPAPVMFPLGAPTLNENTLTVDLALLQPNRITRRIADLTLQKFIVDRIFNSSGQTVVGGAVIYDQATVNQLYTSRDVERVMPGSEYPIVGANRYAPKVAEVEKWGGKFSVTDEARRRNNIVHFNNQVTQLANTIVKKVNQNAILVLEAAIAGIGGAATFVGHNWATIVTAGTSATSASGYPTADFAHAQLLADTDELGVSYDLWILNPQELAQLRTLYGATLVAVLATFGVEVFASNRVAPGTAYAVARGQVGFLDYEQGLHSESWREPKNETSWVQSSVLPVMGVTNPFSIKKVTGLAG